MVTSSREKSNLTFIKQVYSKFLDQALAQFHEAALKKDPTTAFADSAIAFRNYLSVDPSIPERFKNDFLLENNNYKADVLQKNMTGLNDVFIQSLNTKIPYYLHNKFFNKVINDSRSRWANSDMMGKEADVLFYFISRAKANPGFLFTNETYQNFKTQSQQQYGVGMDIKDFKTWLDSRLDVFGKNYISQLQRQFPRYADKYAQIQKEILSSQGGYSNGLGIKKQNSRDEEYER